MSAPPQVKALNCPNCGAALTIRASYHTLTVVCANCLSILDAKDPNLQVLQQFQAQERIQPLVPLGTRGKLRGDVHEVIGFQVRTIVVEGVPYSWSEYLLFNPYKGFRYLTEYQGHWNDVTTLKSVPEVSTAGRPTATLPGEKFRHFQTALAQTTYVLGEFPWQVRVGDVATVMDFVSPPRMLSRETTASETTWSLGEYLPGARVWEAFKLPGSPPRAQGVFSNQPSPFKGSVKGVWGLCLLLLLLLIGVAQAFLILAGQEEVFRRTYSFSPRSGGEASFVTDPFDLKGRISNVELSIFTNLSNNWAYFNFALINLATGEACDFGREVSFYSGVDSDGSWSEGGPKDDATIPSVPPGRYYLRVEPDMDANASTMQYELVLRRDVPSMSYFWIAGLLLLIPPVFVSFRSIVFEGKRWQESDYGGSSSGDDD